VSASALARARRADANAASSTATSTPGRSGIASPPPAEAPLVPAGGGRAERAVPTAATGARGTEGAERAERATGGATAARRKRHHLGFVLFAAVVVGLLVLGLVTLNAFVAQSSFRIDHLQARVDEQSQRYLALERQAAHLSAPGRIAAWAGRHAMRTPDEISVLHVSGPRDPGRGGPPADGSGALAAERVSLTPIVEGSG
jgi:cell division protein FtsL